MTLAIILNENTAIRNKYIILNCVCSNQCVWQFQYSDSNGQCVCLLILLMTTILMCSSVMTKCVLMKVVMCGYSANV